MILKSSWQWPGQGLLNSETLSHIHYSKRLTCMILERTTNDIAIRIDAAKKFSDIESIFKEVFSIGESVSPGDHKRPGSDFGLKVRGVKARENLNAMARDIVERVQSPEELADADREVLMQYSGRGGLTQNSQFEYYTPTGVALGAWDAIAINGFTNGNVLDPCVGAGVFAATKPKGVVVTGTDIDPIGSKIAALLNPGDEIGTGSFESLAVSTPDNSFDAVTGNVPFGDARGASMHDDPAYKNEKRIERYFVLRAIDKVRPGGLCCLVVPVNIVGAKGGKWERFRIEVSKKAEFLGAHKLPSKTFGAQGTDTVVDIIVLKKHPQDLIDRIDDIDFETLKTANVIWDEFVQGKYWMGDGKRFIQGEYVPKVEGERWSREIVDGDIDSAAIRQKLAVRFDSRIDWELIESAPAELKSYIDGDRRIINGRQYEMQDGQWVA
ncbi:MAG: N-6 DNA methylase, partial [Anaerovoracaceae bacterium]